MRKNIEEQSQNPDVERCVQAGSGSPADKIGDNVKSIGDTANDLSAQSSDEAGGFKGLLNSVLGK